jgi:hypothetical protein
MAEVRFRFGPSDRGVVEARTGRDIDHQPDHSAGRAALMTIADFGL